MSNPRPQVEGHVALMNEKMERLAKLRLDHAKAKIAYEHAKAEFENTGREVMMRIVRDPSFSSSVDPRTGKTNEDWRKLLLDESVNRDPKFIEAVIKLEEAQEAVVNSETEVMSMAEEVGNLRTQAILISSLLRYESASGEE